MEDRNKMADSELERENMQLLQNKINNREPKTTISSEDEFYIICSTKRILANVQVYVDVCVIDFPRGVANGRNKDKYISM